MKSRNKEKILALARNGHEVGTPAVVKITLPDNNRRVLATRYLPYLPTEDELRTEVKRSREAIERRLRLKEPRPSRVKPAKRRS